MQNVLRAERDGTVKKIHAAAGATLAVDALILEFAVTQQRLTDGFPGEASRSGAFDPEGIGLHTSRLGV